ncbi:MAG: T9SS type A sorting domain-containing protein [Flavobacteriaceae bacterium]|nr:T9SS type A sorting domain-containing protein [Flavobacteriaceae bacterium]
MKRYLILILILFFISPFIQSQTHVWNGNGGDFDWFNTVNWDVGSIPDATSDVLIPDGFMVELITAEAEVNSISLEGSSTLLIFNNLEITNEVVVSTLATLNYQKGVIDGAGVIINDGNFIIESFELKEISNITINNNSNLTVTLSNQILTKNGFVLNNSETGEVIIASNGAFFNQNTDATLNNWGLLSKEYDGNNTSGIYYLSLDINNYGVINVDENQTFLILSPAIDFNNTETGIIEGNGVLDITANYTNTGTYSPGGNNIGTLEIINLFNFSTDSTLKIQIEGSNEGEYDRISVTGFPIIEGTFNLELMYAPVEGEEFIVLTANSITSCDLPQYLTAEFEGEEFFFEVFCNNTDVTLEVVSGILNVSDITSNENSFVIVSNPVKEETRIILNEIYPNLENLSVVLFNYLGQEIKRQKVDADEIILKRESVMSGLYIIQLQKEGSVLSSQKIIFE